MKANEFQKLASRTLIDKPDFELSDHDIMIIWNAIGLAGEAGEVMELVKRQFFHNFHKDFYAIANELGDVLWYVSAICTRIGYSMEEVMNMNIEKLKKRFPDGYKTGRSH